jgi:hypothetical protein
MPIRQMQDFAVLARQNDITLLDRRAALEQHERVVQIHLEDVQRDLEAIRRKIALYRAQEQTYLSKGGQHGPDQ